MEIVSERIMQQAGSMSAPVASNTGAFRIPSVLSLIWPSGPMQDSSMRRRDELVDFLLTAALLLSAEIGPVLSVQATVLVPISTIPVAGLSDSFWSDARTFTIRSAVGASNVTVWTKYDLTNHSLCIRFRGPDDTYDSADAFNARFHIGTAIGELDTNCWWFWMFRSGGSASRRYNESKRDWDSSRYAWTNWHLNQSSYWEAAFSIQLLLPRDQALQLRLWQQDVSLPPRTWRMSQPFPAGADLDSPSTWANVQLDRRTNLTISATPSEAGFDPILRRSEVVISGSLEPASVAAIVITYINPDGSTFTRVSITDATGSFSDTISPDAVGTWFVSCSWAGTSDLDPSTSERISLNVSYSWLTAIGIAAAAILSIAAVALFVSRRRKIPAAMPPPPPP